MLFIKVLLKIKKICEKFTNTFFMKKLFPQKNIIFFESYPDFSDSTIMVYNELVKRGLDKKYKLIWSANTNHNKKTTPYKFINEKNIRYFSYLHPSFYRAKMMISGNVFFKAVRDEQYCIHLSHGAALKNCSSYYNMPEYYNNAICFSPYLAKYDAINYSCSADKMVDLGYPRNDILFGEPLDLHKYFKGRKFDKVIYWLPTYRQHKNGRMNVSSVAMPIIYNEDIAQKLNSCAAENGVLIIVKPHPAQELSRIKKLELGNLIFIDNDYLDENNILNYELLRSANALITDYSSVYYDYLLTDKPIGLTYDDFEEYKKNEGFTVDPDYVLSGGEKIYNDADLCRFIEEIKNGEDVLAAQRQKIKSVIHTNTDDKSTQRVCDFIEDKLKTL